MPPYVLYELNVFDPVSLVTSRASTKGKGKGISRSRGKSLKSSMKIRRLKTVFDQFSDGFSTDRGQWMTAEKLQELVQHEVLAGSVKRSVPLCAPVCPRVPVPVSAPVCPCVHTDTHADTHADTKRRHTRSRAKHGCISLGAANALPTLFCNPGRASMVKSVSHGR